MQCSAQHSHSGSPPLTLFTTQPAAALSPDLYERTLLPNMRQCSHLQHSHSPLFPQPSQLLHNAQPHLYERTLLPNMMQCPGQFMGLSPYSAFSTSKANMFSR